MAVISKVIGINNVQIDTHYVQHACPLIFEGDPLGNNPLESLLQSPQTECNPFHSVMACRVQLWETDKNGEFV